VLDVPYGRGSVQLPLRDEPDVLLPGDGPKVDPEKALMEAVEHPLDTPPLREVVGGREEVAIVVDDDTRPLCKGPPAAPPGLPEGKRGEKGQGYRRLGAA